jgi:uncharacterized iron-regulated membrane protein
MERTKIITTISIVAVVLAAAAAVGANVGLLQNATDNKVGELAAAGDLPTTADATTVPDAGAQGGVAASGSQSFVVDRAGSVTVTPEPTGLRLGPVEATPGWTWSVSEQGTAHLALLFTDGSSSLLFTARSAADGTVTGAVETVDPPPGATVTDHEDSDDDSHEDDDRSEDDDRDGGDQDEYEGRDDDD